MVLASEEATRIAHRFLDARRSASGLGDYPGTLPATLDDAYIIQDEAVRHWGAEVIGWKIGRIMPPLSQRFASERLAGPIFASQVAQNGDVPDMPVFANGFAAGEAEYLLRIGAALPAGQLQFTLEETADLIDAVHIGIEVASSPLRTINVIGPIAVVSDFGNNNGLVVGPEIRRWRESGFADWDVSTSIDGVVVGMGRASAFPDGAIGSARFLFELAARRNIALRPGQWISTGAVTGVHDALPGQLVEAQFGPELMVRCRLTAARPS